MAQKYPVKHYTNTMAGSPIVKNNFGDITNLLDACLIKGFNVKTAFTFSVKNGTGILEFQVSHGYTIDQVLLVSGCNEVSLNTEYIVTGITDKTVTVKGAPEGLDKIATTGSTISVKVAPQGGWEIAFQAPNIRVYRSKSLNSNKPYIRVDDSQWDGYNATWSKYARVSIHETMTDALTSTGAMAPFSTDYPRLNFERPENTNYYFHYIWLYSRGGGSLASSSDTEKYWSIVADSRFFYLQCDTGFMGGNVYYVGEFMSYKPGDTYNCLLRAHDFIKRGYNLDISYNSNNSCDSLKANTFTGGVILRDWVIPSSPVGFGLCPIKTSKNEQYSGANAGVPYPNGPNYGLLACPVYIQQENGHIRGILPGARWVMQRANIPRYQKLPGLIGDPDRKFIYLTSYSEADGYNPEGGGVLIDITGPWIGNEGG